MKTNMLDQLHNAMIGFDHLFNRQHSTYPPYNVHKGEDGYTLEIACAGFSRDELSVEAVNGELVVCGTKERSTTEGYVYRGIATRSWTHRFTLDSHVQVTDVVYENGMLKVYIQDNKVLAKPVRFSIK